MGSKNKKKAAKTDGNRVYGAGNKPISDERFALSQKDPRFQDVPKHKNKVAIDSRFDRMFTDKHFSTSSARVDKRGKAKNDSVSSQSVLKNYYRNDDVAKKQKSESESDDDVESDEANAKAKMSESESESDDVDVKDDYSSTDTDEDDEGYLEEETNALKEENVPEIDKETNRLAIVNLDWSQVQAVDLYVVLSSFLPKTGQILSVSVYPSEFGLKRMEEEAVRGPVSLFDGEDGKNKNDDDSDNSDDEDDSEIDNEKLRAYELSRLRYYFAVVVCDSIATADYIYKSCDGIEFERSSNKLDLRFTPDDMEFKHPARDVATDAPSNYEGIDFQTRALQLSKIDLTWDENEPHRAKKFKRKINADEESKYVKDEEDLKELIASSDSESDEDDNNENGGDKKRQKTDAYRSLLQSRDGSDEDEDEDNNKVDMEVTFHKDLEGISKKILEKKNEKSETTWDAYLRKRKEKKKARKNRSKNSSDDDDDGGSDDEPVEEMGDFFVGETSQKKKHKKDKKFEMAEEDEASRAELELLLATDEGGDGNNVKGYNMKHKKSKGKKGGKDEIDEEKIPTVDYEDPRFSSVFTRPEFALDPTDPRFKRSAVYVRQVAHKQSKGDVDHNDLVAAPHAQQADDKNESKKDKHEISMLLKSVKMKTKQLELPSNGKKSKRKVK
ncbi:pre-rRNA-processing protein esf1-like [Bidens hawaiensis]|uniref:pre-rRNA-processing protein esf1-like n=1 Tax=Bidens hawaiensis TaxID=980011 RepID=UPI00404A03E8